MSDYYGLSAICERMGWRDPKTPVRQLKATGFFMYRRRRGSHPRMMWYTNEGLIWHWELTRVKLDRERLLARDAERQARKRLG